jgi:hypothetical protein
VKPARSRRTGIVIESRPVAHCLHVRLGRDALQGIASIEEAAYVARPRGRAHRSGLRHPLDVLAFRHFQRLIAQYEGRYDLAIVDTPSTLAVVRLPDRCPGHRHGRPTGALERWNSTRRASINESMFELHPFGAKIDGVCPHHWIGNLGLNKAV